MIGPFLLPLSLIAVFGLLIAVAAVRPEVRSGPSLQIVRPLTYSLAIMTFCSAWSIYGVMNFMSAERIGVINLFAGPALLLILGYTLLRRLAHIARAEDIHSIADFIAARYGRSEILIRFTGLIAIVICIFYSSFQIHVAGEFLAAAAPGGYSGDRPAPAYYFAITVILAAAAAAFGMPDRGASGFRPVLLRFLAVTAALKILALTVVAIAAFQMASAEPGGFSSTFSAHMLPPGGFSPPSLLVIPAISVTILLILLYPFTFHLLVTENRGDVELRHARWFVPLCMCLFLVCVIVIFVAGRSLPGTSGVPPTLYLLAVPAAADDAGLVFLATFAAVSACLGISLAAVSAGATIFARITGATGGPENETRSGLQPKFIFTAACIGVPVLAVALLFVTPDDKVQLMPAIGSTFTMQLAPALIIGLFWRGASRQGALAGLLTGIAAWLIFFALPVFDIWPPVPGPTRQESESEYMRTVYTIGAILPVLLNTAIHLAVSQVSRKNAMDILQAQRFTSPAIGYAFQKNTPGSLTVRDLVDLSADYIGEDRALDAFKGFAQSRQGPFDLSARADDRYLRFTDQLMNRVAGSATTRLLLSLLIERTTRIGTWPGQLLGDAKEAIRDNRALLQTAIDHAPNGLAVFDRHYLLVSWNSKFAEFLGLEPDFPGVGQSLEEIVDAAVTVGALGTSSRRKAVERNLIRLATPGASFFEVLANGTTLSIQSNMLPDRGFVLSLSDVTEYIATQRALIAAKEELELRVQERTKSLSRLNKELVALSAKAHESNASKTRFLAAAGHDILQPLSAARLYSTRLEAEAGDTPLAENAQNLSSSLKAAEEVIDAVLQISRLDSGSYQAIAEALSLNQIFTQTFASMEPVARENGVRLNFVRTGVHVRGDQRLLGRIIRNLVSNAIKYAPGGKVLFGCRRRGGYIEIQVLDNGIGIAEQDQDIIFQEFRRLKEGAAVGQGIGLGLSIVRRLAAVLDTEVKVRSVSGKGTSFSFALEEVAPQQPAAETGPHSKLSDNFAGVTVLCIDNDPQFLSGVKLLIDSWGATTLICEDRDAALGIARTRNDIDLVLCVYELDGTSGIDLIETIRKSGLECPAAVFTELPESVTDDSANPETLTIIRKPLRPAALRAYFNSALRSGPTTARTVSKHTAGV